MNFATTAFIVVLNWIERQQLKNKDLKEDFENDIA